MKLKYQVSTLEQSRNLKALGIIQDYPYMNFRWFTGDTGNNIDHLIAAIKPYEVDCCTFAAFTISEIDAMLPLTIEGRDWYMRRCWRGYSFGYNGDIVGLEHIQQDFFKNETEARADLLIQLLEKKIITVEECNQKLKNTQDEAK